MSPLHGTDPSARLPVGGENNARAPNVALMLSPAHLSAPLSRMPQLRLERRTLLPLAGTLAGVVALLALGQDKNGYPALENVVLASLLVVVAVLYNRFSAAALPPSKREGFPEAALILSADQGASSSSAAGSWENLVENIKTFKYDDIIERKNLNTKANNIANLFIENVPLEARNKPNKEMLAEEIKRLGEYLTYSGKTQPKESDIQTVKNLIKTRLEDFKTSTETIKQNIGKDKTDILNTFFPGLDAETTDLTLLEINQVGGETHNGGKKPAFVLLEANGKQIQIVYKPRSIEVDNLICGKQKASLFSIANRLLAENSNKNSPLPLQNSFSVLKKPWITLPTFRQLSMNKPEEGAYGYAKFLPHQEGGCRLKHEEMKTYYRTIGALQAISQIFGIRDLNEENVIAYKGLPHLIDLEVAFNLESLRSGQKTELADAILNFESGKGDDSFTNNRVILVNERDTSVNRSGEHIAPPRSGHEYARDYKGDIEEGFNCLKDLVNTHKKKFCSFLNGIPDEISLRHVLISTKQLLGIYAGEPANWHQDFCELTKRALVNAEKTQEKIEGDAQEIVREAQKQQECVYSTNGLDEELWQAAFESDVKHRDVPLFQTNMKGELFSGGVLIARAQFESEGSSSSSSLSEANGGPVRNLIEANIQNCQNLDPSNFLKELDKAPPINWF